MMGIETRDVVFCLLILSLAPAGCHGYGYGAPETACVEMFPYGHHANASSQPPPYEIIVNKTTYNPNEVIEVTLRSIPDTTGPDGKDWIFTGVLVQVRTFNCQPESQIPRGSFSLQTDEDFLQLMDCGEVKKASVRHNVMGEASQKTFYWKAPEAPIGHVIVRATVTRTKELYWMNVFSEIIIDPTDDTEPIGLGPCPPRTLYNPYEFCPADYTPPRQPSGVETRTANLAVIAVMALLLCRI